MAKMLAAEASWEAANVCVQTHGGFGLAEEHDVERKFRETPTLSGRADPLLDKARKGSVDLAFGAGAHNADLLPDSAAGRLNPLERVSQGSDWSG